MMNKAINEPNINYRWEPALVLQDSLCLQVKLTLEKKILGWNNLISRTLKWPAPSPMLSPMSVSVKPARLLLFSVITQNVRLALCITSNAEASSYKYSQGSWRRELNFRKIWCSKCKKSSWKFFNWFKRKEDNCLRTFSSMALKININPWRNLCILMQRR